MSQTTDYIDNLFAKSASNMKNAWDGLVSERGQAGGALGLNSQKSNVLNPIKTPQLHTGARSFIQVAGKPLALCQDFNYSVTADVEEIRTIDTHLPWDLSIGQIRVKATLRKLLHPDSSLETEALFHTVQSFIHANNVEIMIQDGATGNAPFFSRGMFVSCNGQYSAGKLVNFSVEFVGVTYQHWVYQTFKPYPKDPGGLAGVAKNLKGFGNSVSKFGV